MVPRSLPFPAEGLAGTAEDLAGTAEALAGTAEHLAGTAEDLAGTAEDLAGTAEHLAGTADGLAGTAESLAGTAESLAGTGEDLAGTADGLAGTGERRGTGPWACFGRTSTAAAASLPERTLARVVVVVVVGTVSAPMACTVGEPAEGGARGALGSPSRRMWTCPVPPQTDHFQTPKSNRGTHES